VEGQGGDTGISAVPAIDRCMGEPSQAAGSCEARSVRDAGVMHGRRQAWPHGGVWEECTTDGEFRELRVSCHGGGSQVNYKILQNVFSKLNIQKHIEVSAAPAVCLAPAAFPCQKCSAEEARARDTTRASGFALSSC
jgi:hypothetical protein